MPKKTTTKSPTARQQLGARGEQLAAEALSVAGYRVIQVDVRVPGGQIDILAAEGDDLVFVEVKTRRGTAFGIPAEAVNAVKQRHLIASALAYLDQHDLADRSWRIDVVSIMLTTGLPQIEIIRHAVEG